MRYGRQGQKYYWQTAAEENKEKTSEQTNKQRHKLYLRTQGHDQEMKPKSPGVRRGTDVKN